MKFRYTLLTVAALFALAFGINSLDAQTSTRTGSIRAPSTAGASGEIAVFQDDAGTVKGQSAIAPSTVSASTSVTVGSGTAITKIVVYTPTVSPSSVAALTCADQSVTVTGVTTADKLIVNPPAQSSSAHAGVSLVAAYVSGADTVKLRYCNSYTAAETPEGGTYSIIAMRS